MRAARERAEFDLELEIEKVDAEEGDDCGECAGVYANGLRRAREIVRALDPAEIARTLTETKP